MIYISVPHINKDFAIVRDCKMVKHLTHDLFVDMINSCDYEFYGTMDNSTSHLVSSKLTTKKTAHIYPASYPYVSVREQSTDSSYSQNEQQIFNILGHRLKLELEFKIVKGYDTDFSQLSNYYYNVEFRALYPNGYTDNFSGNISFYLENGLYTYKTLFKLNPDDILSPKSIYYKRPIYTSFSFDMDTPYIGYYIDTNLPSSVGEVQLGIRELYLTD